MARKSVTRRKTPPKAPAARPDPIPGIRTTLFQAHGVVELARHAITSMLEGLDESSLTDALQVASKLIDDAASALEGASDV